MPIDITGTETFTKGAYQKPASKDTGDVWTDVIEEALERLANHSHSGAHSKKITLNIEKEVQLLSNGVDISYVDTGYNVYEIEFDLPLVADYDSNIRKYYYLDGAEYKEFFPTTEKVSSSRMKLRTSKNGFDLKIIYV